MDLRDAHFELLTALTDDTEPFDQILGMVESPISPRQAIDLLLELQGFGLVSSAVLVDLKTWRQPRRADFERAVDELEGRAVRPTQSDLWFSLTDAGKAEWRAKYGERETDEMWRIAMTEDVLEVNAVSTEVAQAVVEKWQQDNPGVILERLRTRVPAPFTLSDGTRVDPGVLVIFRHRRTDARPLS